MPITPLNSVNALFKREATAQQQPGASTPSPDDPRVSARRQRSAYGGQLPFGRRGFTLTSDLWVEQNKALMLHAGPSEISWTMALRASHEDTRGGRAHYASPRQVSSEQGTSTTYFNLPTVALTFQSGNILPIPGVSTFDIVDGRASGRASGDFLPDGLSDFYQFLELVNQPPLIPSGLREGKHNYLHVYYSSRQFPNLLLKGFIEPEGVTWTDSADAPNSFTWSASMAVYDATPAPWNASETTVAYNDFDFKFF